MKARPCLELCFAFSWCHIALGDTQRVFEKCQAEFAALQKELEHEDEKKTISLD
jgi:sulfite reductase beta subunit-like hemoprotein